MDKKKRIVMWIKKQFNIHNEEVFLKLAEKHSCTGYIVYDYFLCYLGNQELSEIDITSIKYKQFQHLLSFSYQIESSLIDEIIKTLVELKILGLKNNILYSSELKNCFLHMEDLKEKRKFAGKKSAEIRALKKEDKKIEIKTNKISEEVFDRKKIEGFEGSFDNIENTGYEIVEQDNARFKEFSKDFLEKETTNFIEITTECFSKNTEYLFQKNKMEKEASKRLVELVSTGLLHLPTLSDPNYSFEDSLKEDCSRITRKKNSDSRFYLTNLLNFYLSELKQIKIGRPEEYNRLYSSVLDNLDLELLE